MGLLIDAGNKITSLKEEIEVLEIEVLKEERDSLKRNVDVLNEQINLRPLSFGCVKLCLFSCIMLRLKGLTS